MPVDPTQDPEFMKAAPHEQMAYLTQTDPEFAKASPQDQMGYLMHIRGLSPSIAGPSTNSQPVQTTGEEYMQQARNRQSYTGPGAPPRSTPLPPDVNEKYNAALGAGAAIPAAVMGGISAAPAVRPVLKQAAKAVPYVAASEAINYARQNLPGGKYIPPGAEMLPLFMSGGKEEPAPQKPVPIPPSVEDLQMAAKESPYQVVQLGGAKTPAVAGKDPFSGPRAPVQMEPATSTTIDSHGYHGDSQTMTVQFKNGKVYEYRGVPQQIYNQYQQSESQGSFFSNNIKGRYQTRLLGQVKPTPGQQVRQALQQRGQQ